MRFLQPHILVKRASNSSVGTDLSRYMHPRRYCHNQRRYGICTSVMKVAGGPAQNRKAQSPITHVRHLVLNSFWKDRVSLHTVVEAFDLKTATTLSYSPALHFCRKSCLVPEPYSYIVMRVSLGYTSCVGLPICTFNCTILESASQSFLACVIFPINRAACCVILNERLHIQDYE